MILEATTEEDKILEVLEKFHQVSHADLKAIINPYAIGHSFNKTLQKLRAEEKVKYIWGIGSLYWRYNNL